MKLDAEKIEALLRKPESKPRRQKSTDYTRRETRTYSTWFTLFHRLGTCANPDCTDKRPMRTEDGNAMVTLVDSVPMCRYCFLAGFKVNDE